MTVDTPTKPQETKNNRSVRRWVFVAGAVLVLLIAILASLVGDSTEDKSEVLGKQAPVIDLETMEGGKIQSVDLAGRVAIVNFWNSWCIPCKQEAPALKSFYERHKNESDFVMIGIVRDDNEQAARDAAKSEGFNWVVAFDPDAEAALDFGTRGQPETYVINPNGQIVGNQYGPVSEEDLETMLAAGRS